MAEKSADAFRTISEVAEEIGVPQHVLRFWETRFTAVRPLKRGGNRRYYRPEDIELLRSINRLLYSDGYTIKGVQKLLKDKGPKALAESTFVAPPAQEPAAASPTPPQPEARAANASFRSADLASLRLIRDRLNAALAEARAA